MQGEREKPKANVTYSANLNVYTSMAYWVAKTLNISPNEILNNWTAPELIVAFGEYANEQASQNLQDWKALDQKSRAKYPKPSEYIVYFRNDL